jgi:hypothetical protein
MRDHACSCLAEIADQSAAELASKFEEGLTDEAIRYWSILGYANTCGREAYTKLTELALDESVPLEDRAHAVKCLASCSRQTFDGDLPSDPGEWESDDIRVEEVAAWARAGCPDGAGHPAPIRHPALDSPETSLEKIASRLDQRLAKKRSKRQDAAAPSDWLAVAEEGDIDVITSRWCLPAVYLDFLTRFSPVNVTLESRRFWNGGLQLFGAAELGEAQNGYAFDPVKKKAIRGWPKHYLVIASHGGDPFVLDLKLSDGSEAPVFTAEHGMGKWEFDEVEGTFERFLRSIAK